MAANESKLVELLAGCPQEFEQRVPSIMRMLDSIPALGFLREPIAFEYRAALLALCLRYSNLPATFYRGQSGEHTSFAVGTEKEFGNGHTWTEKFLISPSRKEFHHSCYRPRLSPIDQHSHVPVHSNIYLVPILDRPKDDGSITWREQLISGTNIQEFNAVEGWTLKPASASGSSADSPVGARQG